MNIINKTTIKKAIRCSVCGQCGKARTRAAGIGFSVVEITCDRCEGRSSRTAAEVGSYDVPGVGWASLMALG